MFGFWIDWIALIVVVVVDLGFCVAVGNKNDNVSMKVVDSDSAQEFAKSIGIDLFETSAKQNTNVTEAFKHLAQLAYLKSKDLLLKEQEERKRRENEKIELNSQQHNQKSGGCC